MNTMVVENEEKKLHFGYEIRDPFLNLYLRRDLHDKIDGKILAKDVLSFLTQVPRERGEGGIENSVSAAVKKYFDSGEYVGFQSKYSFFVRDIHSDTETGVVARFEPGKK
jgi:hypothetical protein